MTLSSWIRTCLALAAAALATAALVPHPAAAATVTLDAGVVDVETSLGLEGGAAAGTGVVLTAAGEVLTNNHVIRGATTVRVVDPRTKRAYAADVVGYSVASDVAVLQLKGASRLRTVTLARSAAVKVGQAVTAVGNAGGVGGRPSAVRGKVTAVGRSIVASDGDGLSEQLVGLIQTSAPLQPGDSGGPLLNAAGRVIGIDTAASAGFRFQGATQAYAIPIGKALALARQIVAGVASATVHVGSTPFLGVSVDLQGGESPGALVDAVVSGSPAAGAGIVAGDTITAVDGQAVASYDELGALLIQHNAGDTLTIAWLDPTGAPQSAQVVTVAGPPQ